MSIFNNNPPFIFSVDLPDFEKKVLLASEKQPILVDLWADWCSPCIMIAPVLEQVIHHYQGQLLLAKIEVDEGDNMKIAGQYTVRGFPTLILFQQHKEIARFSGAKPARYIYDFITKHTHLPYPD